MANEKRLIDANALFDELIKKQYSAESMGILHTEYPSMRAIVVNQPTVDAVEVVRCENCKNSDSCICVVCEDKRTMVCTKFHCHVPKKHFCSYGERRADG